ncbi:MAG: M48 family metallopeptidase [Dehalococcoidia bacterium]
MTELRQLRFGDTSLSYTVQRSPRRRKTVQIRTGGNGSIEVLAPALASDEDVEEIMRRRASWIFRRIGTDEPENSQKRFVSGETLPYLGRNVRLVVRTTEDRDLELRFDHWRFLVSVPSRLSQDERPSLVRSAIVRWFRAKAEQRIPARVSYWQARFNLENLPRVLIRDQRQRWGSCAPDGTLRFNWRVVMLAPDVLDYVVVHELAHLQQKGHSKEFWNSIAAVMPDHAPRRRRLREAGMRLPL